MRLTTVVRDDPDVTGQVERRQHDPADRRVVLAERDLRHGVLPGGGLIGGVGLSVGDRTLQTT